MEKIVLVSKVQADARAGAISANLFAYNHALAALVEKIAHSARIVI